mmetsp:Transcript_13366/g.22747  ORF Transcript_13366/g.22747 Transcript_13366/m.22747 type:complete len:84 (+) Transcript_13366:277-528(+)
MQAAKEKEKELDKNEQQKKREAEIQANKAEKKAKQNKRDGKEELKGGDADDKADDDFGFVTVEDARVKAIKNQKTQQNKNQHW